MTRRPTTSPGDIEARALPAAARWLLPSLGGLSVTLLAVNMIGPIGLRLLGDSDNGLAHHHRRSDSSDGSVPRTDPFSHSMDGREWFA